ncbi:MAG: hypothetical protein AB1454_11245 [Candidatus Auribacterota bacterium]
MRKLLFLYFILTFFLMHFLNTETVFPSSQTYGLLVNDAENASVEVVAQHEGSSGLCLVYLEDAHCNYLAQKELSTFIHFLTTNTPLELIAVEGSQGDILTDLFATFPVDGTRKRIAENLLKNGVISGEEYYTISSGNPVKIVGVDSEQLYRLNVSWFEAFYSLCEPVRAYLDDIRYGLFCAKEDTYNQSLFEFEKEVISFREGTNDIVRLIAKSASIIPGWEGVIDGYPELAESYRLLTEQKEYTEERLTEESKSIISHFTAKASVEDANSAKKLFFDHLTGKLNDTAFFSALLNRARSVFPDKPELYASLQRHTDIQEKLELIDTHRIPEQAESYISECYSLLLQTDREKAVHELAQEFKYIEHLMTLNVTRNEYNDHLSGHKAMASLNAFIEKYMALDTPSPVNEGMSGTLRSCAEATCQFYKIASERDNILLENTLHAMEASGLSDALLIAGGFHSDAVLDECRKRDISCIVIRPSRVGTIDFNRYASILLRSEQGKPTADSGQSGTTFLRAASFFATHSFDDLDHLMEFRTQFIFNAMLNSLDSFSQLEIFNLVKNWRAAFIAAIEMRYPQGSSEAINALALFDFMVTDIFAFGNIEVNPEEQSIMLFAHGEALKISRIEEYGIEVERLPDLPEKIQTERALELNNSLFRLKNTQVFIAAWSIADEMSENIGHGDAPYGIQYIAALNKRGIEPVVVLPPKAEEFEMTLGKYEVMRGERNLKYRYATFAESGELLELDKKGVPQGFIGFKGKPLVISVGSSLDKEFDSRLKTLEKQFMEMTPSLVRPIFIRVPTVGTRLQPAPRINTIDLYFHTPAPDEYLENTIETGFTVDEPLFDLIRSIRNNGKPALRTQIMQSLNDISKGYFQQVFLTIPRAEALKNGDWIFRFIADPSDAELAAFMHAIARQDKPQMLFTSYSEAKPADKRHKNFLKNHVSFIDLETPGNSRIDDQSKILIINLPPITSDVVLKLIGASDIAALSGERTFTEGLIMNKFGVGPALLFRPSRTEQTQLLSYPLISSHLRSFYDKIEPYLSIQDDTGMDYLSDWDPSQPLTPEAAAIHSLLFDPQNQLLMGYAYKSIVKPVNGLNTLSDLIRDLDEGFPHSHLIASHTYETKALALNLLDKWLMDKEINPTSLQGQKEFVSKYLSAAIKDVIMGMARTGHTDATVRALLTQFTASIVDMYSDVLASFKVANSPALVSSFRGNITRYMSSLELAGNGHLFIPVSTGGKLYYEHVFIEWSPFTSAKERAKVPFQRSELVTPQIKDRMRQDLSDRELVQAIFTDFFGPDYLRSLPSRAAGDERPPFFHGSAVQLDRMENHISTILVNDLRKIVKRHRYELISTTGSADLRALHAYLKKYPDSKMSEELSAVAAMAKEFAYAPDSHTTAFFRDYEGWLPDLESYLNDLLFQKTTNNDYTLSIRSVGSSIGKEAYSLAAIVQNKLNTFARSHIFASMPESAQKEKRIAEWVELWDVRIYAVDLGINRLATTRQGSYLLHDYEISFFRDHPEYKTIFAEYNQLTSDTVVAEVKTSIKKWIVPMMLDLDKNASSLIDIPAEITFSLNIFPYLNLQETVYQALIGSANDEYKSFYAYNELFNESPTSHDMFPDQKLVFPPHNTLSPSFLAAIATRMQVLTPERLAHISGLKTETLNSIINPAKPAPEKTPLNDFYRVHAMSLFETFLNDVQLGGDNQQQIKTFIETTYLPYIKEFIVRLMGIGFHAEIIHAQISLLNEQFIRLFDDLLTKLEFPSAPKMVAYLREQARLRLAELSFTGNHLFVPLHGPKEGLFEHIYFADVSFSLFENLQAKREHINEVVSKKTKERIQYDESDLLAARKIIDLMNLRLEDNGFDYLDLPPTYKSTPYQNNVFKNHLARTALDYLRAMSKKYAHQLTPLYGEATLETLHLYLTSLINIQSAQPASYALDEFYVLKDIIATPHELATERMDIRKYGRTRFFNRPDQWLDELNIFVHDLIRQKAVRGDYTLTVRSIGASIGKEAYSLAAVVEKNLLEYARTIVFAGVLDPQQKETLVQDWVNSWNVNVYAFDLALMRLASAKTGIFRLSQNEHAFFEQHPEYEGMFSEQVAAEGAPTRFPFNAQVNQRLQRWLIPRYLNLNEDLSPLTDTPAEITFSNRVLVFMDKPDRLIRTVIQTTNPLYKSYYGYNSRNETALIKPIIKQLLSDENASPHIIPPRQLPEPEIIYRLALDHGLRNPQELSAIFGVTDKYMGFVFSPSLISKLEELMDRYAGDTLLGIDYIADHKAFIDNMFKPYMVDFVLNTSRLGIKVKDLVHDLNIVQTMLPVMYARKLEEIGSSANKKNLVENFRNEVDKFFSAFEVLPNGDVLIEFTFQGNTMYEHFTRDLQAFTAHPERISIQGTASQIIPNTQKPALIKDIEETAQVLAVMKESGAVDFAKIFKAWQDMGLKDAQAVPLWQETAVFRYFPYTKSQEEVLQNRLASILRPAFHDIARKYERRLMSATGLTGLDALLKFIRMIDFKQTAATKYDNTDLIADIQNTIPPDETVQPDLMPASSVFMRDNMLFRKPFNRYLHDLIAQKEANDDLSITIKSLGSGQGKEVYAIAHMVEQALLEYAEKQVFSYIEDTFVRAKLANRWVDSWNVKIYVFEKSTPRLFLAGQGIYTLSASDDEFFSAHSEYKNFFNARSNISGVSLVSMRPRLQSWIRPVKADLEKDSSPVSKIVSEITFALNIYPYLKDPADTAEKVLASFHPDYKVFYLANRHESLPPDPLDALENQPFTLPPAKLPGIEGIASLLAVQPHLSVDDLIATLGLPDENIEALFPFLQQFTELTSRLNNFKKANGDAFLQPASIELFLHQEVTPQIIQMVMDSVVRQAPYEAIKQDFNVLKDFLIETFTDILDKTDMYDKARAIRKTSLMVKDFFDSLELSRLGDLFIPIQFEGRTVYTHASVDFQAFMPDLEAEHLPAVVIDYTSEKEKNDIIREHEATFYIKQIFDYSGLIDFDDLLASWHDKDEFLNSPFHLWEEFLMFGAFPSSDRQVDMVKTHFAALTHGYFQSLVRDFADQLTASTGEATLAGLANYVLAAESGVYAQIPKHELLMNSIRNALFNMGIPRFETGITRFFRDHPSFYNQFNGYLNNLIITKVAAGDLSISIKSVGASIGKEAYSVAAMVEHALLQYARTVRYAGIEDESERERLVQQWVDSWDVSVFAYDKIPQRFFFMKEGTYEITKAEMRFFDDDYPEYKDMFSSIDTFEDRTFGRIKPRLKRWIRPVQIDLELNPSDLNKTPTEITFAMHILYHLNNKDEVIAALRNSVSPAYQSFIAYNTLISPQKVGTEEAPFTLSPSTFPPSKLIEQLIDDGLYTSRDQISSLLGLNANQKYLLEIYFGIRRDMQSLIQQFENNYSGALDYPDSHRSFVRNELRPYVRRYIQKSLQQQVSFEDVTGALALMSSLLSTYYDDLLQRHGITDTSAAITSFGKITGSFFPSVAFYQPSHFFMSVPDNPELSEHIYLSSKPGNPASVVTELIPERVKQQIIQDSKDIDTAHAIMRLPSVLFQIDYYVNNNELPPQYMKEDTNMLILRDTIAGLMVERFHMLAEKYEKRISDETGSSTIEGLYKYLAARTERGAAVKDPVMSELNMMLKEISVPASQGKTAFFRNYAMWVNELRHFLDDIITQKTAAGDKTLTVRSVASAVGKEAYSIGAVTEQALLSYARTYLFLDIDNTEEREEQIQLWVDSWDVRIYGFDINPLRLALARQGVYKYNPDEFEFFDPKSSTYNYMKQYRSGFEIDTEQGIVSPNGRIKRWFYPQLIDLDGNHSALTNRQAEVTFTKNILMYLDQPDQLFLSLINSTNPAYKAFMEFNETSRLSFSLLRSRFSDGQYQILPPGRLPDPAVLVNLLAQFNGDETDLLLGILGLDSDQDAVVRVILETLPEIEEVASDLFTTPNRDFTQDYIDELVNFDMRIAVRDLITELLLEGKTKPFIRDTLDYLKTILPHYFIHKLKTNGLPPTDAAVSYLNTAAKALFDSISITDGNHLFIPVNLYGRPMIEHTYIDFNLFHPDPKLSNTPSVTTVFLDPQLLPSVLRTLEDLPAARAVIDSMGINLKSLFEEWTDPEKYQAGAGFVPTYTGDYTQDNQLRDTIAELLLDELKSLVDKHDDTLYAIYGDANLHTLNRHVQRALKGTHPEDRALLEDLKVLRSHIITYNINGFTTFFRSSEVLMEPLTAYLNDLILLKAARDEYTLTLTSVGASFGKEPYSLAALVYQSLHSYAEQYVFQSVSDPEEREILISEWISSWDVRIYAVDNSLQKLATLKTGVYNVTEANQMFKAGTAYSNDYLYLTETRPDLAGILFSARYQLPPEDVEFRGEPAQNNRFRGQVNEVLRSWVTPVYFDVESKKTLGSVLPRPSEIVFAMNIMTYLDSPNKKPAPADSSNNRDRLAAALENISSSRYKSFIAFNTLLGTAPAPHNKLDGQPFTLPMHDKPEISDVHNLVQTSGITDPARIISILGLTADATDMVNGYMSLFSALSDLVDNYYLTYPDDFLTIRGHRLFMSRILRFYIRHTLTAKVTSTGTIEMDANLLDQIQVLTTEAYRLTLTKAGWLSKRAVRVFSDELENFLESIQVVDGKDLFIPVYDHDTRFYEHTSVNSGDYRSFIKNAMHDLISQNFQRDKIALLDPEPAYTTTTTILTEQTKNQRIADLHDEQTIRSFINKDSLDTAFPFILADMVPVEYISSDSLLRDPVPMDLKKWPFLDSVTYKTDRQREHARSILARASLDYFRELARKYEDELLHRYNRADVKSLFGYMAYLKGISKAVRSKSVHPLIRDMEAFTSDLSTPYKSENFNATVTTSTTYFFRDSDEWLNPLEKYIFELISMKAVTGDLSFSARSIGSCTGKEAYTIAAVIQKMLRVYARDIAFADLKPGREKEEAIEQWINSWNIQVHMIDLLYQRLAVAQEGIYMLSRSELDFFESHPEYRSMFSSVSITEHDGRSIAGIADLSPRLRSWIVPHRMDLLENTSALEQIPAEITFAMNLLPFIENPQKEEVYQALLTTSNPGYKSFFLYNSAFTLPPAEHRMIDGQEYVVPPHQLPDRAQIENIALYYGISTLQELSALFGLPAAQFEELFGTIEEPHQRLNDSIERSNLVDSMM